MPLLRCLSGGCVPVLLGAPSCSVSLLSLVRLERWLVVGCRVSLVGLLESPVPRSPESMLGNFLSCLHREVPTLQSSI